jgi:ComEC/Rec2-related protein
MTTLLLALAFTAGTTLGLAQGPGDAATGVLVGAVTLAVLILRSGVIGRVRVAGFALALALFGWVHGGLAARPQGPLPQGDGLVLLAVEGASMPQGGRCGVEVRPAGGGARWDLQVDPARCPLASGQRVWVQAGDLSAPAAPRWPGDALGVGVDVPSFQVDALWTASPMPSGYWAHVAAIRHAADEATRGDPARGFVVAAVLGLPATLPPSSRIELRRAGLGHLVAVSGMNVSVAALLLQAPLLRIGLVLGGSLALGCAFAWLPVAAYVGLTGAAAPAVRAAVMFTLVQLGALLGRPTHGLTTLALAGALLLAWRPAWVQDPGFQLSLAAMAVLLRPVAPGEAPPGLLAQSWQVTWATCPIGLVHFGQAAVWGVLSNLVAVPVFTLWILPLGALGCLLWPWFGASGLTPAAWGAQLVLDLAALVARAPEISAIWLAIAAGLMLGVHGLGLRWRRALPGPWICGATIAAALWIRPGEPTSPPQWFAVGGAREFALVVPAGATGLACVHDPGLAPEAWPPLLAALGYSGVAQIDAARGGDPPHVAALREQLTRVGLWQPWAGTCTYPGRKAVRAVQQRCLARTGQRQGAVRAGEECFVAGHWVSLASDGPVAAALRRGWQALREQIDSRAR